MLKDTVVKKKGEGVGVEKKVMGEKPFVDSLPRIKTDKLPSNFKSYDMIKGDIYFRPYTYGEVLAYNQSKLDLAEKIEFIMSGIFSPFELTYFDYLFLSIRRRLITFETNTFRVTSTCEKCGGDISVTKSLEDIEFDDLEVDLPIILDSTLGALHFMPLTVKQFCELHREQRLADQVAVFAKQVINMDYDKAYAIIINLTGEDIEALQLIDKYLTFGIKSFQAICLNKIELEEELGDKIPKVSKICNYSNKIDPFQGETVIVPFRIDRESAGRKIQFGLERNG